MLAIRLPPDLLERLRACSNATGTAITELVERGVTSELKRQARLGIRSTPHTEAKAALQRAWVEYCEAVR
jgi:hypothetical protein